jgi:hypothetical protein
MRTCCAIEKAPDMVLHSPMLAKSVTGKAKVEEAVGLAHLVQSRSSYTSIIATPDLIIEVFDCDADGYPTEGMWIQKLNDQGKIYDLTVMLRPYRSATMDDFDGCCSRPHGSCPRGAITAASRRDYDGAGSIAISYQNF